MAMKRCPKCGEKYSDTYRDCPFCEEDAYETGRRRRRGGRRASGSPNILSPILVVVIVLLAGLLVYLLFGESIAKRFSGGGQTPGGTSAAVSSSSGSGSGSEPDISEPDISGPAASSSQGEDPVPTIDPAALPETLSISKPDFTLNVGESYTVSASGGSGSYQWSSSDEGIASVDSNGKVTGISAGKVTLTVTDGTGKGTGVVYVKGSGTAQPETPTPSGGTQTLNREDMTLKVGESFQLKLSGVTTALSWSSSDSGVATVASDGTVKAVAAGKATITVSWDGASKTCVVRVRS